MPALFTYAFLFLLQEVGLPSPSLQGDASAGHLTVSAESKAEEALVFEQARRPDFSDARVVYRGRQKKVFLSGLADGEYHFRVARVDADGQPGPYSPPARFVVAHHPLSLAVPLFITGAVVFLATLFCLLFAAKRRR